ncbi:glucosaminidase domain-containing protein [Cytobacillus kochii]|uniref:glucosaminidase domain-containing protein n=1 Tax=Cytobacillus kochii TaxID=859143 RepID=UPI00203EC565|nr:SH3 domain-containing protein [Cytobacillus kochii]MCM3322745.1 glucosaminidase domain-containing protein [Cytobacillus kochii]MCM3344776.1 glucosaminidase domain-containing protein [Cytobacillus kochii]
MKKIFVSFLVLLLILQSIPQNISFVKAESLPETFEAMVFAEEIDGDISVYEEENGESEVLFTIKDDSEVLVLNWGQYFSFVEYSSQDKSETKQGYIENSRIVEKAEANEYRDARLFDLNNHDEEAKNEPSETEEIDGAEDPEVPPNNSQENLDKGEDLTVEEPEDNASSLEETDPIEMEESTPSENLDGESEVNQEEKEEVVEPKARMSTFAATVSQTLYGAALKSPTVIYDSANQSAKPLKNYVQGSILKYETYNNDWYRAVVSVNGKWRDGFIKKTDVENIQDKKTLRGVATTTTKIYSKASKNASVLRSYNTGSVLKYTTLTSNWYEATVYVNGKWQTGYIYKGDVESITSQPKTYQGVGLKSPTKVYQQVTTSSKTLKTYSQGSILKFQSFISGWYSATVYINGKATTGYIKSSDVSLPTTNPDTLHGVALKDSVNVYKSASRSSGSHKSYAKGTLLKFETFITGWYKATVYIGGKPQTGYIHASDVEIPVKNPATYQGVALKSSTPIYKMANVTSGTWKSYKIGSILKYESFINGWYKATVYVNGKKQTGYIAASHVENASQSSKDVRLYAVPDTLNVYTIASKSSSAIKKYKQGDLLKVYPFTSEWYRATVSVNGNWVTGYIHKDDLSTEKPGYLNLDLRKPAKLTVQEIKALFDRKGHGDSKLKDYAQEFINVQNKYGVNATYLVAHTILETGWGKQSNLFDYKNNLYGYGAYDVCPFTCGYYFDSVEDSISNVAYQVKSDYLTPNGKWYNGPDLIGMNVKYATDKDWQNKIARLMEDLQPYDAKYYSSTNVVTSNGPAPSGNWSRDIPAGKPYPSDVVKNMPAGTKATINTNANWRSFPYVNNNSNVIGTLKVSTEVIVLGYNTDVKSNGSYPYDTTWYRISVNGKQGWIYGDYLNFTNAKQAKVYTSSYDLLQQFK